MKGNTIIIIYILALALMVWATSVEKQRECEDGISETYECFQP